MTPEQARAWLGVDVDVDADALRRAYLRKVKAHKPERDAVGFRQCREAYELLLPTAAASERGKPSELASEPTAARGAAPVIEPSLQARIDAWRARIEAATEHDVRVKLLREAIAELPDVALWVEDLEYELTLADELEAAAGVLREAVARGMPGAALALFARHAERLDDDELARLRETKPPGWGYVLAVSLLARRRFEEAVTAAGEALADPATPAIHGLPMVLRIHEAHRTDLAAAFLDEVDAEVARRGEAVRWAGAARARWIDIGEFTSIADRLPPAVAAAVALGLRHGDLRLSFAPLADFARERPHESARAHAILDATLPHLGARFAGVMMPSGATGRRLAAISFLAIVALMLVLCLPAASWSWGGRAPAARGSVSAETSCGDPREVCQLLERMGRALNSGRCIEAARHAEGLHARGTASASARATFEALRARAAAECPPHVERPRSRIAPRGPAVVWEEDE